MAFHSIYTIYYLFIYLFYFIFIYLFIYFLDKHFSSSDYVDAQTGQRYCLDIGVQPRFR